MFTISLRSHSTEKHIFIVWCELSAVVLVTYTFFLSSPEHSSQSGLPHRLKAAQTEHCKQTLQELLMKDDRNDFERRLQNYAKYN